MERRHRLETVGVGIFDRRVPSFLEVVSELDDLGTQAAHRRVLLDAVAVRHEDRHRPVVEPTCEREALPVVATRRADHAADLRTIGHKALEVHEATADLEGPDRRVILVLHRDPRPGDLGEQRPRVLRCRRHVASDDGRRPIELVERQRERLRESVVHAARLAHPR